MARGRGRRPCVRVAGLCRVRQEQYPGAWRRGLYLGITVPPVLPPRKRSEPVARVACLLAGPANPAAARPRREEQHQGRPSMNFDDTASEAAFRRDVRAWIDANAPVHLAPELANASFGHRGTDSQDPLAAS